MKKLLAALLLTMALPVWGQYINHNQTVTGPNDAFGLAFGLDRASGAGLTISQILRAANHSAGSPRAVGLHSEAWSLGTNDGELVGVASVLVNRNFGNVAKKVAFTGRFIGATQACSFSPPPPPSNLGTSLFAVESNDCETFQTIIDLSALTGEQIKAVNLIKFPDGKVLRYDPGTQKLVVQ